ncbi:MAG: hypothetical protein ACLVAV_13950 [Clostridium sp.]
MQEIPACKKYDADKVASLIFGEQSDLFDMESAKNIYLTPTDFYVRKNMPVATEINTILTEEFDKVFAGAQSVEETLQNAQKRERMRRSLRNSSAGDDLWINKSARNLKLPQRAMLLSAST